MKIQENVLLAPYTTFKIGGPAKWFCIVKDQFDALEAFEFAQKKQLKTFVLGGGSNVLISDKGFDGLVIRVVNKGIEVLSEDVNQVLLKVASGEVWDEVVSFTVKNNWWGLENLSHIPGSTGAIAVQNVGAYGQEASNLIKSVTVFDTQTHQILELTKEQCDFSYRQSIFNTTAKGKYIIFYLTLALSKLPKPILTYRDLQNLFNSPDVKINDIRNAVILIRDKKYPFPTEAKLGNAGSFFKNPVFNTKTFEELKIQISNRFGTEIVEILNTKLFKDENQIKIPAAFLIELCGLKNLRNGGAIINQNQPLIIINETGTATAKDVLGLAQKVIDEVCLKTRIRLLIEPELIGF